MLNAGNDPDVERITVEQPKSCPSSEVLSQQKTRSGTRGAARSFSTRCIVGSVPDRAGDATRLTEDRNEARHWRRKSRRPKTQSMVQPSTPSATSNLSTQTRKDSEDRIQFSKARWRSENRVRRRNPRPARRPMNSNRQQPRRSGQTKPRPRQRQSRRHRRARNRQTNRDGKRQQSARPGAVTIGVPSLAVGSVAAALSAAVAGLVPASFGR